MTNVLDISVSAFRDAWSPANPVTVPLMAWLTSDKHRERIELIRATEDKEKRSDLKKALPAITPSGVFSYHSAAGLLAHSGLLQFDVDYVEDPAALRHDLSKIMNVAYAGLSVSGRGVWGLVPIAFPAKHKEQFLALKQDFAALGIEIDAACKDVCRLRFMSYDPEGYFNPSARPYARVYKPIPKEPPRYARPTTESDTRSKVVKILTLIQRHTIDVTANYAEEWLPIVSALANEFGEGGRSYAHEVSRFNPGYNPAATDKLFSDCLKARYDFSIGSFFEITKNYGLKYVDARL